MSAPNGFVPYHRSSRYLDLIGPVYEATDDPSWVGLSVDERHTNSRANPIGPGGGVQRGQYRLLTVPHSVD